eukprot:scaffold84_cov388-Prasinococcus_capsulatus_cf.AAC.17
MARSKAPVDAGDEQGSEEDQPEEALQRTPRAARPVPAHADSRTARGPHASVAPAEAVEHGSAGEARAAGQAAGARAPSPRAASADGPPPRAAARPRQSAAARSLAQGSAAAPPERCARRGWRPRAPRSRRPRLRCARHSCSRSRCAETYTTRGPPVHIERPPGQRARDGERACFFGWAGKHQ